MTDIKQILIKELEELKDRVRHLKEILEAARAYHDLPVVDVRKSEHAEDDSPYIRGMNDGNNNLWDYLRTTYPNGLRWIGEL